jgi:hypothetical protein
MSVQDIERVVKLMRRWRFDHERGYWIHELDDDLPFSDKQTSQLGPLKAVVKDGEVIIHARNLYDFIADCVREKPEVVASQVRRIIGRFASPDTKPYRVNYVQFKAFSLSLDQVKELVQYIAGGSPES